MLHRGFLTYILLPVLILPVSNLVSADVISTKVLTATAEQFLHQTIMSNYNLSDPTDVHVEASNIDPRLRLEECPTPLKSSISSPKPYRSNISVKVMCDSNKRWSIYVPAKIHIYSEVAVLARSLERGTIITESDIQLSRMDITQAGSGQIRDLSRALGMQLKRSLDAGQAIRLSHIKTPQTIKKGDSVSLEANTMGISVVTNGKALNSGKVGDQIQVRNNHSKRVVDARIIAPGRVQVRL